MIILEGPDGAGKTTLARELSKEFGIRLKPKGERLEGPAGPPKQHERERVWSAIGEMVTGHAPVLIYDRLYFSELCYGPVWRDGIVLTPDERRMIEQTLQVFKVPVIFCMPPLEQCRDNIRHGEQHPKVADTLDDVYALYEAVWNDCTPTPAIWYDYTRGSGQLEVIRVRIRNYLEFRKQRTWGT